MSFSMRKKNNSYLLLESEIEAKPKVYQNRENADRSLRYAKNNQHLIKICVFEKGNCFYVILTYTNTVRKISNYHWDSRLDFLGGKVIRQNREGINEVVINPIQKMWTWEPHHQFPGQIFVSRLWTGICIFATILDVDGVLEWFVSTKTSFLCQYSESAKSFLPKISSSLMNITFCFQFIDYDNIFTGESQLTCGTKGLYLIRAWKNSDFSLLNYNELLSINKVMGEEIHLSEQRLMTNEQLEGLVNKYNHPETRMDIRKGFVINTMDGRFFKIMTKPWIKFSQFPIVDEKNIKKFMYDLCKSKQKSNLLSGRQAVLNEIKKFYPHLSDTSFGYNQVRIHEIQKLEILVNKTIDKIILNIESVKKDLPEGLFTKYEIMEKINRENINKKTVLFLDIGFKNNQESKESFIENMETSPNFLLFSLLSLDDNKV